MSEELKPCPFCGPKAGEVCIEGFPSCGNCGVTQPDSVLWNSAHCWKQHSKDQAAIKDFISAGWEVVTHPAFTEGTKSFENLPQGLIGRILRLKEVLSKHPEEQK